MHTSIYVLHVLLTNCALRVNRRPLPPLIAKNGGYVNEWMFFNCKHGVCSLSGYLKTE